MARTGPTRGPLNLGFAEVLGDGLIAARNYWPSLGLSQRFFLMVLPGGDHQLSLALLSRGDQLRWTVVGEYRRQVEASEPPVAPPEPIDPAAVRDDPTAGPGPPAAAATWPMVGPAAPPRPRP